MLANRKGRPDFNGPGRETGSGKTFIHAVLQMSDAETRQAFVGRLTDAAEPDIQLRLYAFVKAMVCSWAGRNGLSGGDAGIIEECRKICDVMGWPPDGRFR